VEREEALVAVIIVIAVVVLIGLYVMATYNRLIGLKNKVDNGWAQIDVQLRRRHDLIPNLVETVKGYAAHEKGTLEAVIHARNTAMAATGTAQQSQAENVITGALRQLFALSEAYPDLKANQGFLNLQDELTGTEGRIAYARQFFNDLVARFNTKIQRFPANLIAGGLGFGPREFFEAEETSRAPVQVSFSNTPPPTTGG
jgi:LemA protein